MATALRPQAGRRPVVSGRTPGRSAPASPRADAPQDRLADGRALPRTERDRRRAVHDPARDAGRPAARRRPAPPPRSRGAARRARPPAPTPPWGRAPGRRGPAGRRPGRPARRRCRTAAAPAARRARPRRRRRPAPSWRSTTRDSPSSRADDLERVGAGAEPQRVVAGLRRRRAGGRAASGSRPRSPAATTCSRASACRGLCRQDGSTCPRSACSRTAPSTSRRRRGRPCSRSVTVPPASSCPRSRSSSMPAPSSCADARAPRSADSAVTSALRRRSTRWPSSPSTAARARRRRPRRRRAGRAAGRAGRRSPGHASQADRRTRGAV